MNADFCRLAWGEMILKCHPELFNILAKDFFYILRFENTWSRPHIEFHLRKFDSIAERSNEFRMEITDLFHEFRRLYQWHV